MSILMDNVMPKKKVLEPFRFRLIKIMIVQMRKREKMMIMMKIVINVTSLKPQSGGSKEDFFNLTGKTYFVLSVNFT